MMVTAVSHILEEVALPWYCGMFLFFACDDEKCSYRKFTAQHSKRLEYQINYLSVFECLILLESLQLMIARIEGCFPADNYFQMTCETSTLY